MEKLCLYVCLWEDFFLHTHLLYPFTNLHTRLSIPLFFGMVKHVLICHQPYLRWLDRLV
jgi:hypothetical protein